MEYAERVLTAHAIMVPCLTLLHVTVVNMQYSMRAPDQNVGGYTTVLVETTFKNFLEMLSIDVETLLKAPAKFPLPH